jgi:hypothetical protein
MRPDMRLWVPSMLGLLAAVPAVAQSPPPPGQSAEVPVDHGPDTPAANSAYQGGGVILQGAPGAPAPKPQPTPPGQTPQNMVPTQ